MCLCIENLDFAYRKNSVKVLEKITCEFERGKFYGIFGSNGCGKSTLLKVLANLLPGSSPVMLDGKKLKNFSSKQRAQFLGYAAQENELNLPFTVRECIKLGRYAWSDSNDDLIDSLIAEWNMEAFAGKNFSELSGGEQQKIKLLRVLAQDSDYILLDEPGSSLDWTRQLELYERLQKIAHTKNKCVIMVCHDIYLAPSFIDQMLVLADGRLIYNGVPSGSGADNAVARAFGRDFTLQRESGKVVIQWQNDQAR